MKVDRTNAEVEIDYYHHLVHEGRYYRVWSKDDITTGATLVFGCTTGVKEVHIVPATIISSVDKLTYEAYEDTVYTDGTPIVVQSHNRIESVDLTCSWLKAPTVTSAGNIFSFAYIPGATGVGGTRSGASSSSTAEFILKPNSKYSIKFTNNSSATNTVFFMFNFYEE